MHTVLSSVPLSSHSQVKSNVRNCTCRSKHSEDAPATSSGSSSSTHGTATNRNHFPQLASEKTQRHKQRLDQPALAGPAPQNPQSGAVPHRRHQQRHAVHLKDAKLEFEKVRTADFVRCVCVCVQCLCVGLLPKAHITLNTFRVPFISQCCIQSCEAP